MDLLDIIDMDLRELRKHLGKRYRESLQPRRIFSIEGHRRYWMNATLLVWTIATLCMIPLYIYADLTQFHLGPVDFVLYLGFILLYSVFSYLFVCLMGIILFTLLSMVRDGLKELLR